MPKLLLVEDELNVRQTVEVTLQSAQYEVDACGDGHSALALLRLSAYDLLVLDWNLPDMTGLDICKRYRQSGGESPVLFLTGRTEQSTIVTGLDAGADDYLKKPFATSELLARVRALLRRHKAITEDVLTHLDLKVDVKSKTVTRKGERISLAPKEFDLLVFFMRHPHEVFSADSIASYISDASEDASENNARTIIWRLREALDVGGQESYIRNVRSHGYGLSLPSGAG